MSIKKNNCRGALRAPARRVKFLPYQLAIIRPDPEHAALLTAIGRTEANIILTERSLADRRAKFHNQLVELLRQVRLSTLNPQPSTGGK